MYTKTSPEIVGSFPAQNIEEMFLKGKPFAKIQHNRNAAVNAYLMFIQANIVATNEDDTEEFIFLRKLFVKLPFD